MSKLDTKTTCSGIEWNAMLGLLVRLKKDNKLKTYLLIATGCYLGLRARDLLNLRWEDVLNKDELVINESKTSKSRVISVNKSLKEVWDYVSSQLISQNKFHINDYLFANKWGNKVSLQYLNRLLKKELLFYRIATQNPSTHTLRKTFGKHVWEMDGKSERSLIYLSQIFNHTSSNITRRYVGIIQDDIRNIYLNL